MPRTRFSHRKKRHVILGNSAAAVNAVQAIREFDPLNPIALISAEPHMAYSPVLLTYYVAGKIKREALFLADKDFYTRHKVDLILANRAEGIDASNQRVHLADGQKVAFDDLLIATGSSAKSLDVDGASLPGVYSLKTVDDGDMLVANAARMEKVVIIGGGLIGIQAANALYNGFRNITMVIGSQQPLSQNVDPSCGENVCQTIRECGINILFSTSAVGINQGKQRLQVELDSGDSLEADAVIVGKGVRPNTHMIAGSGVQADVGILVDEQMCTSVDNIFAAGDVTESANMLTGERQVIATWPNACGQGHTAGANMAGEKQQFHSLNMNVCSFLGNAVASVGITKPQTGNYKEVVRQNMEHGFYRKLVWNQYDELVGAVLMGKIADIGVLTHMIRTRAKVPETKRKRMVISSIAYGDHFTERVGHPALSP